MKKILFISLLLFSCENDNVERLETDYSINTRADSKVKILTIDSCEYLFFWDGNASGLTHKGNCSYCQKRNND